MLYKDTNHGGILGLIKHIKDRRTELAHLEQLRTYNELRTEELHRKIIRAEAKFILETHKERDPYGNLKFPTQYLQQAQVTEKLARDRSTIKRLKLIERRKRRNAKLLKEEAIMRAEILADEDLLSTKVLGANTMNKFRRNL